jgi:hypothetical protein
VSLGDVLTFDGLRAQLSIGTPVTASLGQREVRLAHNLFEHGGIELARTSPCSSPPGSRQFPLLNLAFMAFARADGGAAWAGVLVAIWGPAAWRASWLTATGTGAARRGEGGPRPR